MARQICKEEFRVRNFFYHFEDERAFYTCQWKWPHWLYACIRLMLAAYTLFAFIYEVIGYYDGARIRNNSKNKSVPQNDDDPGFDDWDVRKPWCVYFTLWTYMVLMSHMILAALLTVTFNGDENIIRPALPTSKNIRASVGRSSLSYPRGEDSEPLITVQDIPHSPRQGPSSRPPSLLLAYDRRPLPWYFKLSWILSNVISSCAPLVTTIFFLALYEGGPVDYYNINIHILNTVFVVLDHMISARPVRLLHWPAPVLFGTCYTLFSYIFWTFDHVNHVEYKGVMDWNQPGQALFNCFILAFVVTPVCHSVYFVFYRFKLWIFDKIYAPPSYL